MSKALPDRKLASTEIDLVVHLLRVGASTTPVTLLSTARPRVLPLWRLGIVHIWHRQSLTFSRPEGPFYSLTRDGVFRAEGLLNARAARAAAKTEAAKNSKLYADEFTPPPPDF